MDIQEEREIKKEFLLERAILFSDAVFAIIITIMVIEIHLPEGMRQASEHQLKEAFLELIPKVLSYIISFAFIAGFWLRHLKIFGFLKDYNITLLIYNLIFLFFLSLFPASVSIISGAIHINTPQYNWGVSGYILIVMACMFMQSLLVTYLVKHKSSLCINTPEMEHTLKWKMHKMLLYIIPVLAVVIALASYFQVNFKYMLMSVSAIGIITSILRKRYYPNDKTPFQYIASTLKSNKKAQD